MTKINPIRVVLGLLASLLCAASHNACAQSPAEQRAGSVPHVPYSFHHVRVEAGGFLTGILFHPTVPGLAYLRTDIGGAYRWDGKTGRWTSLSEWIPASESNLLGVESMAVDPTRPNDVYLAVGTYTHPGVPNGALLRSHDRGAHFEIIRLPFQMGGNEPGRFAGERLALDPAHHGGMYLGTRNNGLWHSNDFGSTWMPVANFPGKSTNGIGVVFAVFGQKGSDGAGSQMQPVYIGVSTTAGPNLYVSSDGGDSWRPVNDAPTGLLPYHAAFTTDGRLYVTYGNAPGPNEVSNGAVWERSAASDGGRWRQITPEPPSSNPRGFGYAGLALDPHDPNTVLVSTLDRWQPGDTIFASRDGGRHWASLTEKAVRDASASPYLVHAGKLPFGHWVGAVAIDPYDPDHVFYGTGETLWTTHDLGQAWRDRPTHWTVGAEGIEETAVISLLSPSAGAPLFPGLGDIGCFRADSVDAGVEAKSLEPPSLSNCDAVAVAAQHPQSMAMVGRVWTGPRHGGFSDDGGQTWKPFLTEPAGSQGGGAVVLTADGETVLWTTAAGVFQSRDHGAHWEAFASCQRAQVMADPRDARRVFVLPRGGDVLLQAELPRAGTGDAAAGNAGQPESCVSAQGVKVTRVAGGLPPGLRMVADPVRARLWLFGAPGLFVLDGEGGALQRVSADSKASAFGLGRAMEANGPETLFLAGQLHGRDGIFRSTDGGQRWQHLDDATHGFGYITTLAGDLRNAGRVYLGTNGLGVIVAEPAR